MLSSRLAQRCLLLDNAMLPESPRGGGVVVEIIDQGGIIVSVAREREEEGAPTLWLCLHRWLFQTESTSKGVCFQSVHLACDLCRV